MKSTDLTKTMVTTLKREHDATKRKMCGKNNITSRHYINYPHSRIYPNFVWVYFVMELRVVALGNLAIEGIHNPSDRISSWPPPVAMEHGKAPGRPQALLKKDQNLIKKWCCEV